MKFVFYCFSVRLMPRGVWQHLWRKMNVVEIWIPERVTLIESEIIHNISEPLAKFWILYPKLHYKYLHSLSAMIIFDPDCLTSTSGRLHSCAWLLLFEMLHVVISLCLVFYGICCTTLTVDSVVVNYLCWRSLFITETSPVNKYSF